MHISAEYIAMAEKSSPWTSGHSCSMNNDKAVVLATSTGGYSTLASNNEVNFNASPRSAFKLYQDFTEGNSSAPGKQGLLKFGIDKGDFCLAIVQVIANLISRKTPVNWQNNSA